MIDYASYQQASALPKAAHILESFRAMGYSMPAAVADIIDNSISAGADQIWLDFEWKGKDTIFAIRDNGEGMDDEGLINAMRPGSRDPEEIRTPDDLGRFGLGLKTASFSQSRKFSVISKTQGGTPVNWCWDMDYIRYHARDFKLINFLPQGDWLEKLNQSASGTIVIWHDLDAQLRGISPGDKKAQDKFLQLMQSVRDHVAMVFHRYIESGKIRIRFNGRDIPAWNPFMISHNATQCREEEPLSGGLVRVRGFILPHKSKLSHQEFLANEGIRGWNGQQGFYVYRKERMLVSGSWLGLFRKEEHHKLARIMIDLPNSLDSEWQIDVKKSVARAPGPLRDILRAYATSIRQQAAEVYRHRGKLIRPANAPADFQPVWQEMQKDGRRFYRINRAHPLISSEKNKDLNALLRLIEETIPIPTIVISENENPDSFTRPYEGESQQELIALMKTLYQSLLNNRTAQQAREQLMLMAPFNEYPELIASL